VRPVAVLVLCATLAGAAPKKQVAKPPDPPRYSVALAPVFDGTVTEGVKGRAEELLAAQLASFRVERAPVTETAADAQRRLTAKKLVGVELTLTLKRSAAEGLDASLLLSTYPGHALKTELRASASGAPIADLVAPLVQKLVADAALELKWQRAP